MSECPVCHKQIEIPEASRGTLFACPKCNAVYFISWDGVPETPPAEEEMIPSPSEPPMPAAFENPPEISIETPVEQEWPAPSPVDAAGNFVQDPSDFSGQDNLSGAGEFSAQSNFGAQADQGFSQPGEFNVQNDYTAGGENPSDAMMANAPSEEITIEVGAIEYAAAEFPDQAADYDFNKPLGDNPVFNPHAAKAVVESSIADAPTFEDVTDFGNADTVSGPLTYTVIIEGIDTGKIYGELKEALEDSRFRWNVPEMVKTIHEGRLEIKDLNPAKAFTLVNRIKYLALKITWRQDVLG